MSMAHSSVARRLNPAALLILSATQSNWAQSNQIIMTFVIGLLVFAMVLVSIALIFLVLIQLPKKDAGAGLAFGGGATDALFGAGSGTVLTKVTKWAAIAFFGLALLVGTLQSHNSA